MDNLQYFKTLEAIHNNKSRDEICESFNYSSDEFESIIVRYNKLKIAESADALYIEKQNSPVSLTDYIKYKVWLHSGPEAYYDAIDNNKELCENVKIYEKKINLINDEYKLNMIKIRGDYELDLMKIKKSYHTTFIFIFVGVLLYNWH